MRKFRTTFRRRMELGLEYYEGDLIDMICLVHEIWIRYGNRATIAIDKTIEKIKPNGWQIFANEWLVKHPDATAEAAYAAYVDMMKNSFLTNEYAEFSVFELYPIVVT